MLDLAVWYSIQVEAVVLAIIVIVLVIWAYRKDNRKYKRFQ